MFVLFDFQMGLQKGPKSDFSHFFFRNQNYQFSHLEEHFLLLTYVFGIFYNEAQFLPRLNVMSSVSHLVSC